MTAFQIKRTDEQNATLKLKILHKKNTLIRMNGQIDLNPYKLNELQLAPLMQKRNALEIEIDAMEKAYVSSSCKLK